MSGHWCAWDPTFSGQPCGQPAAYEARMACDCQPDDPSPWAPVCVEHIAEARGNPQVCSDGGPSKVIAVRQIARVR